MPDPDVYSNYPAVIKQLKAAIDSMLQHHYTYVDYNLFVSYSRAIMTMYDAIPESYDRARQGENMLIIAQIMEDIKMLDAKILSSNEDNRKMLEEELKMVDAKILSTTENHSKMLKEATEMSITFNKLLEDFKVLFEKEMQKVRTRNQEQDRRNQDQVTINQRRDRRGEKQDKRYKAISKKVRKNEKIVRLKLVEINTIASTIQLENV